MTTISVNQVLKVLHDHNKVANGDLQTITPYIFTDGSSLFLRNIGIITAFDVGFVVITFSIGQRSNSVDTYVLPPSWIT